MRRCMVVDDSSVIRKVARRILSGSGFVVVESGSGLDALDMCATDMPDIIIVDVTLPDIETVDFIRRVCAMAPGASPHLLICMTEMDIGAIMRAKRAGASGYVLKPFNRPQLLERFRQMVQAAA